MATRLSLGAARQDSSKFVRSVISERWLFLVVAGILGVVFIDVMLPSRPSLRASGGSEMQHEQPFARRSAASERGAAETFGTMYHNELSANFKALTEQSEVDALAATLNRMAEAGIRTVTFGLTWEWGELDEGQIKFRYLDSLMDVACNNASIKVNLAIDLATAPPWLWKRFPDAVSLDADGRMYNRLSLYHNLGNAAARQFVAHVATHLANGYGDCIIGIQPVYNSAYRTRYSQEYDSFQDYSPYALLEYRLWLKRKGVRLELLNVRWQMSFKEWTDVVPPQLHSGDVQGVDFSARYWDWLRFREEYSANVYVDACTAVVTAGLQCFHRFPEFFSVVDAIYGASLFKRLAAAPSTSFLVMESNLVTPRGNRTNAAKLRLHVAVARAYGKPVHFEAALESVAGYVALESALHAAWEAGADGLGMSYWLTRLEANDTLAGAFAATTSECAPTELLGVFLPLDSCSAFHGWQWGWGSVDPLYDFIQNLAERLPNRCETELSIYVELGRFLADFDSFSRVLFVEPLVLYDTNEFAAYLAAKTALKLIPHEVLRLPANVTSGPQFVALQDMTALAFQASGTTAAAGLAVV